MHENKFLLFIHPVILFISLGATIALTILGLESVPRAQTLFSNTGYFFMIALVVTFLMVVLSTWRNLRLRANSFWGHNWPGMVFALFLASLVFISVPSRHTRLVNDEQHILSTAESMALHQKVIRNREVWRENPDFSTNTALIRRPILLPFLTSLLHTFSGYRISNIFVANFLSLFGFLFGIYCFLARYMPRKFCLAAMLLIASQPIVSLCSTSGILEVCNLAFIIFSFLVLRYFLDAPSTLRFQLLIFSLLLLSNVQYASFLFLILIPFIIGIRGHIKASFILNPSFISIAPLFTLPLIWQRIITCHSGNPDYPSKTQASAFGFEYMLQNISDLPAYFFNLLGIKGGFAGGINIAGAIAIIALLGILIFRVRKNLKSLNTLMMCVVIPFSLLFFMVLLYYSGVRHHPLNGRLYLPIIVLLSISPIILAKLIIPRPRAAGNILLFLAIALFLFYFPFYNSGLPFHKSELRNPVRTGRELQFVLDFWEETPLKKDLIIFHKSPHLSCLLQDAISLRTANKWRSKIYEQYKLGIYNTIYVIQRIDNKTGFPLEEDRLDKTIPLDVLAEQSIRSEYLLRISKIKDPSPKRISGDREGLLK